MNDTEDPMEGCSPNCDEIMKYIHGMFPWKLKARGTTQKLMKVFRMGFCPEVKLYRLTLFFTAIVTLVTNFH